MRSKVARGCAVSNKIESLVAEALAAIKGYARMTDEQAEAILSKCIYEEG